MTLRTIAEYRQPCGLSRWVIGCIKLSGCVNANFALSRLMAFHPDAVRWELERIDDASVVTGQFEC